MDFENLIKGHFIVYYRQSDALNKQIQNPDSRVFTFETPLAKTGGRRFICTTIDKFCEFYQRWRYGRWFYELIPDGWPCRPYFDLEFYTKFNPEIDSIACFQSFITICKQTFKEVMAIELNDSNFLVLDSTTDEKFSAHVIVHLPDNYLFPSNLALKPLVGILCGKMLDSGKCIVKKEDGSDDFLCDRSVYSKNRNFRMYYSSKCGKDVKLLYAKYCNFYNEKPPLSQFFYDALIVPKNHKEYNFLDVEPLVVTNQIFYPHLISHVKIPQPTGTSADSCFTVTSNDNRTVVQGHGSSPFVELDEFLLGLMRPITSANAQIRSWSIIYSEFYHTRKIIYELKNCRFCYNVLREHKSNNVYWIFDLDTYTAYQRCYDHECRQFMSRFIHVPYKVEEMIKRTIDKVFASYGIASPNLILSQSKCKSFSKYDYSKLAFNM